MNDELKDKFREECFIRNRTSNTTHAYISYCEALLKETGKDPKDLDLYDARNFILKKREAGISAQCCNAYNSAFRFFYRFVLHKKWDSDIVPRMKVDRNMPDILTVEEIEHLIDTAKDIRYKAIIAIIYSGGLRVSEAVELKYDDISRANMLIHVRKTKNHSDHYTIISQRAMDLLTQYWFEYDRPKGYLFFAKRKPHNRLGVSGVETAIREIAQDAGITKRVYPHLLRHCFATHMMEAGVDPLLIQSMLGHRSFESTNFYIHLANKNLMGVKSPLDHPEKKKRGRKKGAKKGGKKDV